MDNGENLDILKYLKWAHNTFNGSGNRRFDIIYEMTEKGFIERVEENEE